MDIDWIRRHCLSFPHTTEQIQWGHDLVFKIAGKMYAVVSTEPDKVVMSFKVSEEDFAELVEREGVVPAPYLARAHWAALEAFDALPRAEIKQRLSTSYEMIRAKLPRKALAALEAAKPARR